MKKDNGTRAQTAIVKEIKLVEKQESSFYRRAMKQKNSAWRFAIEDRVPEKVYRNLQKAFCKAFEIIFEKGVGIIEKTYDGNSMGSDYKIRDYAFKVKEDRGSLRKFRTDAWLMSMRNMAFTSVEGLGLGALGIGLPDIVLFVGVLLRGIYEISLSYGFEHDTAEERYFILKLMETSVKKGSDWEESNRAVDEFIIKLPQTDREYGDEKSQIICTADAFALDMVLLKFIQGLPVVGMIGGAGNPLYYNKVIKYAELKYRKRYLLNLKSGDI